MVFSAVHQKVVKAPNAIISVAKIRHFFHIPILFANYLMDSYFFSRFKEYNFLSVLYKKIIREDTSYFLFCVAKVRKRNEKACGEARKVTAEGASLHICSEIH